MEPAAHREHVAHVLDAGVQAVALAGGNRIAQHVHAARADDTVRRDHLRHVAVRAGDRRRVLLVGRRILRLRRRGELVDCLGHVVDRREVLPDVRRRRTGGHLVAVHQAPAHHRDLTGLVTRHLDPDRRLAVRVPLFDFIRKRLRDAVLEDDRTRRVNRVEAESRAVRLGLVVAEAQRLVFTEADKHREVRDRRARIARHREARMVAECLDR